MNKHLNEGQLRAALDGELDVDTLHHLEVCPACQIRQRTIQSQAQRAADQLTFLSSPRND